MNRLVGLLIQVLVPFFLVAQENVGIGTLTPAYRLDVQGDTLGSSYININSQVNFSGEQDLRAIEGTSVTAPGFGIGGRFVGGYKGIEGICQGGAYNGIALYGVLGLANGTAGTRVGVYGAGSGGTINYGVWGYVNGGANNYGVFGQNTNLTGYAGYFNGRGFFTHELRADRNLVVDDTTWTHQIQNQSGIMQMQSISDIELKIDRNNSGALTGFFEIFNGGGDKMFYVNEFGVSRSFGNHLVDGSLGIGALAPGSKLQILGGTDASLTTNGYAQFGPSNTWNLVIDDNEIIARNNGAGNDLLFQQDAGNILMCGLEQGSVGIGVQFASNLPAGYMLSVDGKIVAEELRIQNSNNWPDYVFSDQYKLMPLNELKTSIETNRHLPNIPSAATVLEEGILIGDMQKKMMEKIEELTLYILELHETNQKQQQEIKELQAALAKMQNP